LFFIFYFFYTLAVLPQVNRVQAHQEEVSKELSSQKSTHSIAKSTRQEEVQPTTGKIPTPVATATALGIDDEFSSIRGL
jgi:hypothetical protein